MSRHRLLGLCCGAAALLGQSVLGVSPQPQHIEISPLGDTSLLPYCFVSERAYTLSPDRPGIQKPFWIFPNESGWSELIVQAFNAVYHSDEAASVLIYDLTRNQTVSQDPLFATFTDCSVFIDGASGRPGVAVGCYRHDSAFVARNFPGTNRYDLIFLASGTDRTGNGRWEPGVIFLGAADYDYDGLTELFFRVSVGRDLMPRVLACVDIENLRVEWSLPVATSIDPNGFYPCGDSGNSGLLFVSYGPDNGVRDAHFDDRFGYLTRVDRHGEVVFNFVVADSFRGPLLRSVPSQHDRFAFFQPGVGGTVGETPHTEHGVLSIIDGNGVMIRRGTTKEDPADMQFALAFGSSYPLLHVVTRAGGLRLYDSTLSLVVEADQPQQFQRLLSTLSLPGEPEPGLLYQTSRGLELFSSELERLALLPAYVEGVTLLRKASRDDPDRLLLTSTTMSYIGKVTRRQWYQYVSILFWRYRNLLLIILAVVSLGLLVLNYVHLGTLTKLRRMEERNQAILNATPDLMFRIGRHGHIRDYQIHAGQQLLVPADRLIGRTVMDILPPYVAALTMANLRTCLATRKMQVFEYQLAVDGKTVDEEARLVPCGYDEVLAIVRDITEKNRAEQALHLSRERLRAQFEAFPMATYIWEWVDPDFVLTDFNAKASEVTHGGVSNFVGSKAGDMYRESPDILKDMRRCLEERTTHTREMWYHFRTTGKDRYMSVNYSFVPPNLVMVHADDITERQLAVSALAESEAKFRAVAESVNAVIIIYDAEKLLYANPAMSEISGYSPEELTGMSVWQLVHPDQREEAMLRAQARFRGEPVPERLELKVVSKAGRTHWVEFAARLIEYRGKRAVLGTALDMTERKLAALALEESEAKFRAVAESMTAAITIFDETKLLYCNPASVAITGYSLDELAAMSFWDVIDPEYKELIKQWGRARLQGEDVPQSYEVKIRAKSGAVRWVQYAAKLIEFQGQQAVLGTAIDVTDRKLAEEKLRTSERRFDKVTQESRELVWEVDTTGLYTYVSQACEAILGYRQDEMIGKMHCYDLHPPEGREEFKQIVFDKIAKRTPFRDSVDKVQTKDGGIAWLYTNGVPVYDEAGEFTGFMGADLDITERKLIEEDLFLKERALASSINALALAALDGRISYVNDAALRMWGCTKDQALNMSLGELANNRGEFDAIMVEVMARGHFVGEAMAKRWDGTPFHVQVSASLVTNAAGEPIAVLGAFVDITKRLQAESALRESEEQYRAVVEGAGDAIMTVDTEGVIRFANTLALRNADFVTDGVVGQSIDAIFPREVTHVIGRLLQNIGSHSNTQELTFARGEAGTEQWYSVRMSPLRGPDDTVLGAVLFVRDISESVRAGQQIKRERDFSRSILETANSLIICLDENARLTVFNEECERVTGYSAVEVLGKRWPEMFLPPEAVHEGLSDFKSWVARHPKDRYEGPLITKRGEVRTILWSNSSFLAPETGRLTAIAIGYDITERRRDEARLQQVTQAQYNQVKQIAGGIAHEIYNALFPATTSLYKLRERLGADTGDTEQTARNIRLMELIEAAVLRAIKMTDTVMKYSRLESSVSQSSVNLRDLVDELIESHRGRLQRDGVEVTVEIDDDLEVRCMHDHLFSLLSNLMGNSLDAMCDDRPKCISIAADRSVENIRIRFADTGAGIPPENLSRIFDPFYSTKPRTGTGLGLAISRKIAELYGGSIEVESVIDKGTQFIILLAAGNT
ncbi:MAG: PAS domain S-box protein [Candidatus Zixiibacteriota bacterium]